MKLSSWLPGLVLASGVTARRNLQIYKRQSNATSIPSVPVYNFSMPVDHFNSSDTRTYNNRFFVNDTYYKPGGPVILFDAGEQGISDGDAAQWLAEAYGFETAQMRLAANISALVVGWEHRYYGYSLPVPMDYNTGTPVGGAADYAYLTIEQALEDVAYFAKNIHKVSLDQNKNVNNTSGLSPDQAPWIFIGGSYPGARAAWARVRNPEVWYASWASSAPVEARADGSIYWDQVSRALPSNCTSDLFAISTWTDQQFKAGDNDTISIIQAGVYLSQDPNATDISPALELSANETAVLMINGIDQSEWLYQDYGAHATLQVFCDYLESFDGEAYIKDIEALPADANLTEIAAVGLLNPGDAPFTSSGIVSTSGQNGSAVGFAAFTYATYMYAQYAANFSATYFQELSNVSSDGNSPATQGQSPDRDVGAFDNPSWEWQTFNELGYYQYANTSTRYLSSAYYTEDVYLAVNEASFPYNDTSDFPTLNTTGPLSLGGGWTMTPSNVMFTNGQYDPWRAFGVASIETEDNAPQRPITTTVPQCNQPPQGDDVFGLVYAGAVHVEDLQYNPIAISGSESAVPPMYQGLALFLDAWSVWAPCFKPNSSSTTTTTAHANIARSRVYRAPV